MAEIIEKPSTTEITLSSETRLKKISAKIRWTITDFQLLNVNENRRRFPNFNSSIFFLQDNVRENSFQICFHYDYKYLQVKCTPDFPKYTTIVCSILGKNDKVCWQSQPFVPPLYRVFLSSEFLLQSKQTYLPNNILRLVFRVEIIEDLITKLVTDLTPTPSFSIFEEFFKNQTICDVSFLVENQELKAHKIVLAARSPVFLAMFRHEFSEGANNVVTIVDIRCDVFKALLQYVYNNEIENIEEIADELLIAADKYLMEDLKLKCEQILIVDMVKEKAGNLLSIAIQCKCENLEACCRFHLLQK